MLQTADNLSSVFEPLTEPISERDGFEYTAYEIDTLHGLLEIAGDMLAHPHRFSRQDRFMLLETLEMVTQQRSQRVAHEIERENPLRSGEPGGQLALTIDEEEAASPFAAVSRKG